MITSGIDTSAIIRTVLSEYSLPARGHHGVVHWARVLENGLRMADATGADPKIVTLFALFHDSRRVNEHKDHGHGTRGGDFARTLRGTLFELNDTHFELFYKACCLHTDGHLKADITVQVCWDADRLDLGRVAITPKPERLCTNAARDILEWSHERAIHGVEPDFVKLAWGT